MNEKDVKLFNKFQQLMIDEIEGHNYIYGDSWKRMTDKHMKERIKHKIDEYELTKNPKKLVSIANLAMLQFIKTGAKWISDKEEKND